MGGSSGLTWPLAVVAVVCIAAVAAIVVVAVLRSAATDRDSYQTQGRVRYRPPPEGYQPPTVCEVCREPIRLTAILGGVVWLHTDPHLGTRHQVVIRPAGWWDTRTGRMLHGNSRLNEADTEGQPR